MFLSGGPEYVFWLLSLLSPSAFAMAYDKLFLVDIEQREIDFWETDGTVPLGGILIMMSVDIVLYGLLAYYLDNVLPTEYGTRRKPWFPFQLSFWVSGQWWLNLRFEANLTTHMCNTQQKKSILGCVNSPTRKNVGDITQPFIYTY